MVLTYDLNTKRAQFYLNGQLDEEIVFAGNLALPLASGFRVGPKDGQEASDTLGNLDDFRIYDRTLSPSEIAGIYGQEKGDFYSRTINFTYSEDLELPILVTATFLEDGYPVELNASAPGSLEINDF